MAKYKVFGNDEVLYLNFRLREKRLFHHNYNFVIYSENKKLLLECSARFHVEQKVMHITAIMNFGEDNKGYGSIAMKEVIRLSLDLKANYIKGHISHFDTNTEELKSRVHGFYKKHFADIKDSSFSIDLKKHKNIIELLEEKENKKRK